jgi:hypothetical protein
MAAEITGLFEHLAQQVSDLVNLVVGRFSNNVGASFSSMSLQQWIRLGE